MRIALFLIALAGFLGLIIRFLVRYSTDSDSRNSDGMNFRAHDSTRGAYERQIREMVRAREAEDWPVRSQTAETSQDAEPRESHPESHTGA